MGRAAHKQVYQLTPMDRATLPYAQSKTKVIGSITI